MRKPQNESFIIESIMLQECGAETTAIACVSLQISWVLNNNYILLMYCVTIGSIYCDRRRFEKEFGEIHLCTEKLHRLDVITIIKYLLAANKGEIKIGRHIYVF